MKKLKENLCTNCGGNLKYDPSTGMNRCDHCGTEFNVGQSDQPICPDCGNKLILNFDAQALECSVCQNSFEIPKEENATQSAQIDSTTKNIIPFSVDKKKAKVAFIRALSNTEAIPADIYQRTGIIDFAGYYVPFYRYFGDYTATFQCSVGYDREEQYTEYEDVYDAELGRSVRRPVTKTRTVTDWHPYSGNDVGDFCIDVCASSFFNNIDDSSTGFLNDMCGTAKYKEYNEQYTTGFRVLPFVIDTNTAVENDGNAQIDRVVASNISSKLPGDHYKNLSFNWQCNRNEFTLLKPVWYTKYAYDGSAYYVLTDGTSENNNFGFAPQSTEKKQKYNNIKDITWALALSGIIFGFILFFMGWEKSEGLMAAGFLTFIAGLIAGLIGYNVWKHAKVKDTERMRSIAIEYERNPDKVFNRKTDDIKVEKTKQSPPLTPKEKPLSFSNYSKYNLYYLFFILLLVFGSLWFIPGVINIFSPDTSSCIMGIMGTVLLTISFFCCWRGNAKVEKLKAEKNIDSTKNKKGKIVGLVCMILVLLIGTISVISPQIESINSSNNSEKSELYETVKFGGYEWIVVKSEVGKSLLFSKNAVATLDEDFDILDNGDWESSYIRKYLNDDFYNGFSAEEKNRILSVENLNEVATPDGYKEQSVTNDKIFLLSAKEIFNYLKYNEQLICKYNGQSCFYFVRTGLMGSSNDKITISGINAKGQIRGISEDYETGQFVYDNCLRPAMWVSTEEKYAQNYSDASLSNSTQNKWKEAYINYINEHVYDSFGQAVEVYKLVNINNDGIPELYIDFGTTAGGAMICTYHEGKVIEQPMWSSGFSYREGQNIFRDSGGKMDVYYDNIYSIENGQFVLLCEGNFGASDNSNVKFDSNGSPIYNYFWNGTEVSSETEYMNLLNEIYNVQQAISPFDGAKYNSETGRYTGNGLCDYEEIIEAINTFNNK